MTELEVVTHTADLQDLSLSQKIVKALALAHLSVSVILTLSGLR